MSRSDESQIALRLPADVVREIDRIADYLERDRQWVIEQALRQYLAADGADILDEAEGFAELDRAERVLLADVLSEARQIVAAAGKKRAS